MTGRSLSFLCLALLCGSLFGCGAAEKTPPATAPKHTVRIAAASDLKFAMEELAAEFQRANPDISLETTFGSSGNFYSQLSQQAPFDLFLSADIEYPRKLQQADLTQPDSEFVYAVGHLVIWARRDAKLQPEEAGPALLTDSRVKKIAIANPQHAPYGRAAVAALKSLEVYDQVQDKLVLGENVSQTAQFVESGAADVGIIALSLALAPAMQKSGEFWEVPLETYPKLEQGGIILKWARDPASAERVRDFLSAPAGRTILKKYGFLLPGE